MTHWAIGIDIGGTFTDVVALDYAKGRLHSLKVLTTHGDPAEAVIDGVERLVAECRIDPAAVERVVHATTLFTNALIERNGAPTGLLTTRGFRDVLEIGNERKYELYDLTLEADAARAARLACRDRRTPGRAGRRARAARRGRSAGGRAAAGRGRRRVGRGVPAAFVRVTRARAPGARLDPRRVPGARGHAVLGSGARDPGVRARLHHGRQRLHQAARAALPRRARLAAGGARHAYGRPHDAVQRRPVPHPRGQAQPDRAARVRARRPARSPRRTSAWRRPGQPARLRHGRHDRQALPGRRTASRSSRTGSRRRAASASRKAAACRSASRRST